MMRTQEPIDRDYDYENCCLKNKLGITSSKVLDQAESDFAITRIQEILGSSAFFPRKEFLYGIHEFIFRDIYPFAGKPRTIQIFKNEKILQYLCVDFAAPQNINSELDTIFENLRNTDFESLSMEEQIDFTTKLISDIWKVHPFREGNTRTTLIFLRLFLRQYQITFSSERFKTGGNFKYMRDALVASAFEAEDMGVKRNYAYLKRVIGDIIKDSYNERRSI